MTPSARLEAAVEILVALESTAQPVDRFLRSYFRARRYAGSKDRAAVAERLYAVFRHRASFAWRMRSDAPRALVIASLLADGADSETLTGLFAGKGYGPKPLSDAERSAIRSAPDGEPPLAVKGEFPAFLEPELCRAFGEALLAELEAMQVRAPIDLRVNTLKTTRAALLSSLREDGFDVAETPFAPQGLRIPPGEGAPSLGRSALFLSGAFEFQDEAAQIAARLCDARPGERILDLAAGAGGKSLAFAADMQNEGEIVACDIREGALTELAARAARAGASIIVPTPISGEPPEGPFDAVFVDAPCSGTGTWRRQPELRWRLTPEGLASLRARQDLLLRQAAGRTRKGGRLLYATCSVLPSENEDRIEEFLKLNPGFTLVPVAARWSDSATALPEAALGRCFCATPHSLGTDGFFVAFLVRER